MEVADQWRRQWAGTAEYGKVTEGGVTRRIARAMEVLHASGPGARVRVMRAAYHSSAGPGAPAESFMLHSSRRVISSGFNLLESPSTPSKPLEISSTPLELIHDSNGDTENYKVTEPDDLEISEPSKWRGSTRASSIRMPSEESSSTDNASIIDLDSKNSKNLHRKYSYDSESSDVQFRSRSNSRSSQLLDAPSTLSTLKYKSLLNNSNEWNTRRKSYSFEDTSPLNETILHGNDTLAMESSTDSGICKSTELVNDHIDDNSHIKYFAKNERKTYNKEESFRDWLCKNRQNSQYKGTKYKTYREHEIVIEDPKENNIALQSSGKVSISLPITIEIENNSSSDKPQVEDIERKVKKVEFCKTEVHFAAESGKVNIIATDEKPPPSNDFRKRRSAFVPMQDMMDRPITLFGEKNDFPMSNGSGTLNHSISDFGETDENTAATKSILKNKIPKPKPYLLGENMDFGISGGVSNKNTNNSVLTAVSLVNQQMESKERYKGEIKSIFSKEVERNVVNSNIFRTINGGPTKNANLKLEKHIATNSKVEKIQERKCDDIKNKFRSLQESPTLVKPKTRQLRDSDLTYFGIDSDRKMTQEDKLNSTITTQFASDNVVENIFHSVKLIQQVSNSVSNSVCDSEPESEDAPEYQNIPLNINYAPVPTPRLRSKYEDKPNEIAEVRAGLKPIIEKECDDAKYNMQPCTRRTKGRREVEVKASRSLSAPPKNFKRISLEKPHSREDQSSRKQQLTQLSINDKNLQDEEIPIYVNLNTDIENPIVGIEKPRTTSVSSQQRNAQKINASRNKVERNENTPISDYSLNLTIKEQRSDSGIDKNQQKKRPVNKDTVSSTFKRDALASRTEKASKFYYNNDIRRKLKEEPSVTKHSRSRDSRYKSEQSSTDDKKEQNTSSLQRSTPNTADEAGDMHSDHNIKVRDTSTHRKRNTSKDKTNAVRENVKPSPKLDSNSALRDFTTQTKSEREKEYGPKSNSHKANKHREYVINYDDKNGTVSSICKIKPGLGPPRRKKASKDILKENHKDNTLKTKTVDKIALRK